MSKPDKSADIYERLAQAMDALPCGFPRTKSGVEMELLKMAFSPDEARVACHMTRTPETPARDRETGRSSGGRGNHLAQGDDTQADGENCRLKGDGPVGCGT